MTRKRWKLIALWSAAIVLALIAAGAYVYQRSRAAVEDGVQKSYDDDFLRGNRLRYPEITFRRVGFDSESWMYFRFDVYSQPEDKDSPLNNQVEAWWWGLREWDVVETAPQPRFGY